MIVGSNIKMKIEYSFKELLQKLDCCDEKTISNLLNVKLNSVKRWKKNNRVPSKYILNLNKI